ncbi:hypothetical protein J3R83DRAFT_8866 [Lanmaoa asiatica]|nr:hypothetical protein J3R83DRAFT_8866 [Lanmaoa asiatica]
MPAFPNDPAIPLRLRNRLQSWATAPPATQFQQYGPLNAFLSVKFPPAQYLVKPQALLREISLAVGEEEAHAILSGRVDDPNMDVDGIREVQQQIDLRRLSVDSTGAFVHPNAKSYPDFVVTSYGEGSGHDVIRLVIELGSLGRQLTLPSETEKEAIEEQLLGYLAIMGQKSYRWENGAAGIAIIGTQYLVLRADRNGQFGKRRSGWSSLYSEGFTNLIDQIRALNVQ